MAIITLSYVYIVKFNGLLYIIKFIYKICKREKNNKVQK